MKNRLRQTGSTLIELLVTVGIVAGAGGTFFWVMGIITMQAAKNNAIDYSHQNARELIGTAVQQLHSSASIPQLIDATLATVAGNGPSAGVRYQTLVGGPGKISSDAGGTQSNVAITMNSPYDPSGGAMTIVSPAAGMRLIIPAFQTEDDISAVTGTSPTFTVTMTTAKTPAAGITLAIPGTTPQAYNNYQVYYTTRSALVVYNGNLLYYPDLSKKTASVANDITTNVAKTIVRNVTTATPFSIPSGNNQFIQVNLATNEPNATNRGYQEINFQTTLTIPFRYRLTTYQ